MADDRRSDQDRQHNRHSAPDEPPTTAAPAQPGSDRDGPADVGAGDASLSDGPPNRRETQDPDPSITGADGGEDAAALQRELSETRDKHLRLAAEFDNYRKRVIREREEAHTRAQAEVVSRLIDVLDDMERVAHFAEDTPSAALLEGFQLLERKLHASLQALGLEPMDAAGKAFDPATMEALATVPAESPEEDDTVADVFQKGYTFRGVLVRPARVRVKQHEG